MTLKDKTWEHHYYSGIAYSSHGDFRRAATLFARALEMQPDRRAIRGELVRAHCYLARRALARGEVKAAIEHSKRANRVDPKSLVVHRNLGLAYLSLGNARAALDHANRVLDVDPGDILANRIAGRSLVRMKRSEEALLRYTRAVDAVTSRGKQPPPELLVDQAGCKIALGMIDEGIADLEAARGSNLPRGLAALITRNLVRARLARGRKLLVKGETQLALQELKKTIKDSSVLSKKERSDLRARAIVAIIEGGRSALAKQLLGKYAEEISGALLPPYNQIGEKLLLAYTDCFSPSITRKRRAAARLQGLAASLPASARGRLLELAGSTLSQIAFQRFKTGKAAEAAATLRVARRLARGVAFEILHNAAVADYYSGRSEDALGRLQILSARVPLAYCNLGIHHEGLGAAYRSYGLLSQCERKGGRFPGLGALLDVKRQIFGKGKGAP